MTIIPIRPIPAIIEEAEEHDRKECIALDKKVDGANRELAQWLVDHPVYTAPEVAKWLSCHKSRVVRLRSWAASGFEGAYSNQQGGHTNDAHGRQETLKTKDNFEDDTLEPSDEMEKPALILSNILDSIKHQKAVAEAYRKILKDSPFDREAKVEIHNAIQNLIVKWRTVQSTLDTKGPG